MDEYECVECGSDVETRAGRAVKSISDRHASAPQVAWRCSNAACKNRVTERGDQGWYRVKEA